MALSKPQPRGCTHGQLPIPRYTLPAAARVWWDGEVVGQDSADGTVYPLVPGLTPMGVSVSSIDYSAYTDGEKGLEVRAGAVKLPHDGTITVDSAVGTPVYWNGTANVASATDGAGAYAFCGPLVVCRSDTTVEVAFEPERAVLFGGDMMLAKTITHADLNAAALTQQIAIGVAPGRFIGGAKNLTANFAGGGAASVDLDVGGTDADGLIAADDVLAGPLAEDFAPLGAQVVLGFMPNLAGQTINALFTGDVNVVLLTAGSVTIRLFFKRVP